MKINDLPKDVSLGGVHFRTPEGVEGYWYSQWSYPPPGVSGVFYKKHPSDTQLYTIQVDDLKEALDWEVVDG